MKIPGHHLSNKKEMQYTSLKGVAWHRDRSIFVPVLRAMIWQRSRTSSRFVSMETHWLSGEVLAIIIIEAFSIEVFKIGIEVYVCITFQDGDRFNSCQVIYSQFGLAIHQNDHQARSRFDEWAQNEIAVVPDFHKRILFSDEAHFWLNGYVNKQNCRICSEANPQVYVETPLHPEKLTVWCALWAGGILLQKR
ncbi:hypothetical protein TNCV_4607551 [Trichonephila clavipes]|nr:hypothetical protein TNCV_4607551 [Trichonephila clavipes]